MSPCTDAPHLLYLLSIDGHLGCFHVVTAENNSAVDTCVQVALRLRDSISFGYKPRNGIAGSHSSSVPNVLKKLHPVCRSGRINGHSQQQSTKDSLSSVSHPFKLL